MEPMRERPKEVQKANLKDFEWEEAGLVLPKGSLSEKVLETLKATLLAHGF